MKCAQERHCIIKIKKLSNLNGLFDEIEISTAYLVVPDLRSRKSPLFWLFYFQCGNLLKGFTAKQI